MIPPTHILCADKQTRDSGLALLDKTYAAAATFKLAHQMASIERIRNGLDQPRTTKGSASVTDPTPAQLDDARLIWDYHQMGHELRPCDAAIGLGSHDLGVAEFAAELYLHHLFPMLVFSGATSPTTVARFPRGEAVHYREHAVALGIPDSAILVEPRAANTGQNIEFSHQLLEENGVRPYSVLLISKPYMERRAYATCRKLWPEVEPVCTSEPLKFEDYVKSIGDRRLVLDMLVGDLQRVIEYPKQGFAIDQTVPDDVLDAYRRLIDGGYTSRLMT